MRDELPSQTPGGPAERPVRQPSRPYGVRPAPAALVRDHGQPMEGPAPSVSDDLPESITDSSPLRPRQEAFCHYFVLYGNATTAAAEAGYAGGSCKNQGYRLLRRPEIRARIAEIRAGLAATCALDADVLLGKLEALYQRAVEDHHFHAAARAVELQARIAGHVESRARLLKHVPAPGNDDR